MGNISNQEPYIYIYTMSNVKQGWTDKSVELSSDTCIYWIDNMNINIKQACGIHE